MNTTVAVAVAILSLLGSVFAVYENRKTDDRKTDVSAFEAITTSLRQDNKELREEVKALRTENIELRRRVVELERRQGQ